MNGNRFFKKLLKLNSIGKNLSHGFITDHVTHKEFLELSTLLDLLQACIERQARKEYGC